jgi:hypothetical protein
MNNLGRVMEREERRTEKCPGGKITLGKYVGKQSKQSMLRTWKARVFQGCSFSFEMFKPSQFILLFLMLPRYTVLSRPFHSLPNVIAALYTSSVI